MKVFYDEEVDVMNIIFVEESDYVASDSQQSGDFIFDFDANGDVIGIEILTASAIINQLHKK
jgi:uncharacterized protein YuzE